MFCALFFALSPDSLNAYKWLGYCVVCVSFETPIFNQFPMKLPTDLLSAIIPGEGGGGGLQYMGCIGTCHRMGYGFRGSRSLNSVSFLPFCYCVPDVVLGQGS